MPEIKDSYEAKVVEARFEPSDKPTKGDQIVVECVRLTGPRAGTPFMQFFSLKGGAAEISAEQLCIAGWDGEDITSLDGVGSLKFKVSEWEEEYQGKVRPKYRFWPLTDRPTLRDEDKDAFRNKYAALSMKVKDKGLVVEKTEANAAPDEVPTPAPTTASSNGTPTGASF